MLSFPSGQLGPYRLIRQIGSGGMGEVYLAEDTRLGVARQVAIKTVRIEADLFADEAQAKDAERLFKRETLTVARLDHPYILPLYDFGEERVEDTLITYLYLVMPFRPEGSLADWLRRRGLSHPLSLEEAAHFVSQAAQALYYVHRQGLIHQDVKPANFLVRERSEQVRPDIQLSDFGIAKIITTTTVSQNVRGTWLSMAPEQWQGHPVPATDQYALAIMAYWLVTRRYPFQGSWEQLVRQHLEVRPQPPSVLNPAIPPALDSVICTALQKSPEDRFASIAAFANAFAQAILPEPASPPAPEQVSAEIFEPAPPDEEQAALEDSPAPASAGQESSVLDPSAPASAPNALETEAEVQSPLSSAVNTEGALSAPSSLEPALKSADARRGEAGKQDLSAPSPPDPDRERRERLIALVIFSIIALLVVACIVGGVMYQQSQLDAQATFIAEGDTQATIDAQTTATADVQATVLARAQLTATAVGPDACPIYIQVTLPQCGSFKLKFSDSLQSADHWQPGNTCQYTNNTFQMSNSTPNTYNYCDESQNFSNFVFEVHMTIVQGDCGGAMIQHNPDNGQGYLFLVCSSGDDYLTKYTSSGGSNLTYTYQQFNSSAVNILAIAFNHGSIVMYVNQQEIASYNDDSFSSGEIALIATDLQNSTTVNYTDARVWA